jgi:hypothetical protein
MYPVALAHSMRRNIARSHVQILHNCPLQRTGGNFTGTAAVGPQRRSLRCAKMSTFEGQADPILPRITMAAAERSVAIRFPEQIRRASSFVS